MFILATLAVLGGDSLQDFAVALLLGLTVGDLLRRSSPRRRWRSGPRSGGPGGPVRDPGRSTGSRSTRYAAGRPVGASGPRGTVDPYADIPAAGRESGRSSRVRGCGCAWIGMLSAVSTLRRPSHLRARFRPQLQGIPSLSTGRQTRSSAGGAGLLAWVHDLGDRASSASCRATARGSRGGAVHRLAVGCAGPARRGADVVDDPGGAACRPWWSSAGSGTGSRSSSSGCWCRPTATTSAPTPEPSAPRPGSRMPPRPAPPSCHRDLHLAAKLDGRFAPDPGRARGRRDRRGEGGHRHRRGGAADGGARRPAARHRGAGRGAPARARPGLRRPHAQEAGQAAVRGGLPRGGRRRRGQRGWRGRRPGPARSPTSRSTTTATAPATDASGCPPCTRTC